MSYWNSTTVGEEVRYCHKECGDTRERLYVKRTRKGYLYNCFNCNWNGFKPIKDGYSLSETKERLNGMVGDKEGTMATRNNILVLPYDCVYTLPSICRAWLDRYSITEDEVKRFRICWSDKLNRLILPLYNREGELIFYQGRNVGKITKENPKYLNVRAAKGGFADLCSNPTAPNQVCIVEGILDAIKVGRNIHAIPILGSYVSTKLIQTVKDYDKIFCWLDYDKRFQSLKYTSQLRLFTGKPCVSVVTKRDPKELLNEEIKEQLSGSLRQT